VAEVAAGVVITVTVEAKNHLYLAVVTLVETAQVAVEVMVVDQVVAEVVTQVVPQGMLLVGMKDHTAVEVV
jgi:hypothetical protein